MDGALRNALSNRRRMEHWPGNAMASTPPTITGGDVPQGLHTAEEIAETLKVDPKTVLNWAKVGIIPEAFRVGRTVRFSLDAVKAALDVNQSGAGRRVELVALALKDTLGVDFPKIPRLEMGSITMDERAEVQRLCAEYVQELEGLDTPQERFHFAQGVLDAAEILSRIG